MPDIDRFLLIAGAVSWEDYIQNPADFDPLIEYFLDRSNRHMPFPNAFDSLEAIDATDASQCFPDIDE